MKSHAMKDERKEERKNFHFIKRNGEIEFAAFSI